MAVNSKSLCPPSPPPGSEVHRYQRNSRSMVRRFYRRRTACALAGIFQVIVDENRYSPDALILDDVVLPAGPISMNTIWNHRQTHCDSCGNNADAAKALTPALDDQSKDKGCETHGKVDHICKKDRAHCPFSARTGKEDGVTCSKAPNDCERRKHQRSNLKGHRKSIPFALLMRVV
jgi:hypothetical protein